jgi:hypothetical protein
VPGRDQRVVSDMNSVFLSAEALGDIERLGIELADGGPLTVSDYDADDEGNPTWLVVEGIARFDAERRAWRIEYSTDDVRWERRED